MRFKMISSVIALFTVLLVSSLVQAASYVLVEEPQANVYKELDPKSPLVVQAKKGDYLELVYNGTSWNKVLVDGQEGWIERRAGKIVENKGGVPVFAVVFFIIVIAGSLGGALFYIAKNHSKSMVEVDEV